MKSARSFESSNKTKENCESHNYCVHQHYQKCQNERNSKIAYNIFPTENLNASVNVHRKCTNQYSYNFKTLAYEKFVMGKEPETELDRNFVKNFYLENVPEKMVMTNEIVQELEHEVFPFNAYNLAEGATKNYYEFEYKRQQYLVTARRRAKNNSNAYVAERKEEAKRNIEEREKWIQKILSTLQDLSERIFGLTNSNKENEEENGKERIFLNEKSYVDEKYLQNYKIRDIETSKRIFEDLRAVMLRKKRKLEDERIKNKNVNLTMSQLNESTTNQSSVNAASQSMISAISEADQEKNEEKMISELCDFENLKKKWKSLNVERIKDIILSTLTRKIIFDCESEKAKKISSKKRESQSIPVRFGGKKAENVHIDKNRSLTNAKHSINKDEMKIVNRSKLTKEESETKEKLLKTGRYDVAGRRYEHARKYSFYEEKFSYSELFRRKEKDLGLNLSFLVYNKWKGEQKNTIESFRMENLNNNETTTRETMKGYKTTRATSLRM